MFQWATLPNSLSTAPTTDSREEPRFNGRHCPTPCQPDILVAMYENNVSMGDIAQLPVNTRDSFRTNRKVSMGDIAQLPVNDIEVASDELLVSMGDIAQLPVNPNLKNYPSNSTCYERKIGTIFDAKVEHIGTLYACMFVLYKSMT